MVWGISRNGISDIPNTEELKDALRLRMNISYDNIVAMGLSQQLDIMNYFCICALIFFFGGG